MHRVNFLVEIFIRVHQAMEEVLPGIDDESG